MIIIFLANLSELVGFAVIEFFPWLFNYPGYGEEATTFVLICPIVATVIGCALAARNEERFKKTTIVAATQLVIIGLVEILSLTEVIQVSVVTNMLSTLFEAVTELFVLGSIQSFFEKRNLSVRYLRFAQVFLVSGVTVYLFLSMGNWVATLVNVIGAAAGYLYVILYYAVVHLLYIVYLIAIAKGILACRDKAGRIRND